MLGVIGSKQDALEIQRAMVIQCTKWSVRPPNTFAIMKLKGIDTSGGACGLIRCNITNLPRA